MIIATAGHVDHGKTSLVMALTGVQTDSLAEEQRRGMTIDLGFASTALSAADPAAGTLGFVDVPGHERFVRNMLAGVASVDLALLVVAADDGPMPQTHEHLAILALLGVPRCVVALTKIDRVTVERRQQVEREIAALLAAAPQAGAALDTQPDAQLIAQAGAPAGVRRATYADAPLFPVVANAGASGAGMAVLRQHLADLAAQLAVPSVAGGFRLVVDRSFALAGAGRIVTGAVLAGQIRVGDEVVVSPAGTPARVRSIQVHNRPTDQVSAGQRCALNLAGAGLKRAEPVRGDWVVAPALHAPTNRLDVMLTVLGSAARPLSQRHTLQLHLGAAVVGVRVAALTAGIASGAGTAAQGGHSVQAGVALAPGSTGLAQAVLDRPLAALHGDHFILRDPTANHTLAGGWVVDPFGAVRGRSRPLRLRQLAAMARPDPAESLAGLLSTVSTQAPEGVDLQRFALARGLGDGMTDALVQALALRTVAGPNGALVMTVQHWQTWRDQLLAATQHCHAEQPDSLGPDDAALRASLAALRGLALASLQQTPPQTQSQTPPQAPPQTEPQTPPLGTPATPPAATGQPVPAQVRAVQRAALAELVADGLLLREGLRHRCPGHQPVLTDADRALLDRVASVMRPAGLRPPIVGELASTLDLPLPELLAFLGRAARLGLLARVAPNRYYLPETVGDLLALARSLAAEGADGGLDAAAFRDRSGIGRNLTVHVLEFLDREGLTRFDGSRHWPLA